MAESVLYDGSWEAASTISQIPFLDQGYYGNYILNYKAELDLLGVLVGFKQNYGIVIDHLKPSMSLNYLRAESLLLALKCIRNSKKSETLIASLKDAKCLRANIGHLNPSQCFLFDREWGCILKVFDGFPLVDGDFYGNKVFDYKYELAKIGVMVDFDVAMKAFCNDFKQRASSESVAKENVLSFLSCYKKLRKSKCPLPTEFKTCVLEAKWLRTRLADFRSPKECILYGPGWESISQITGLPFVDDRDKCYGKGIHEFKDELENLGVVVDFKKGAALILENILFQDPTYITPESAISLLECIKNF